VVPPKIVGIQNPPLKVRGVRGVMKRKTVPLADEGGSGKYLEIY
jgi:hypothetical protein